MKCFRCGQWPCTCSDGQAIIHGDCRDILPEIGMFDLVMTDPPYGMEFRSNHRNVRHRKIAGDDALPLDVVSNCLAKANNAVYIWCRWDNLAELPRPASCVVWVKDNHSMGDLSHEHGRKWEACCFYPLEGHKFIKRIPDVVFGSRTGNVLHPTQKPVCVVCELLQANVGETVLDPFMGSGTTLVACKELGRRSVGIELDERYCEIAAERLRQGILF